MNEYAWRRRHWPLLPLLLLLLQIVSGCSEDGAEPTGAAALANLCFQKYCNKKAQARIAGPRSLVSCIGAGSHFA
jgi:hypothetical protein